MKLGLLARTCGLSLQVLGGSLLMVFAVVVEGVTVDEGWWGGGVAGELNGVWCSPAVEAGFPAVCAAVLMEDDEALAFWRERGAWVNEVTAGGDSALALALRVGRTDLAGDLVAGGADLDAVSLEGQPLLITAALTRRVAVLRWLLKMGCEVDVRSRHPVDAGLVEAQVLQDLRSALTQDRGLTALMIAASHGDAAVVELLLEAGARVHLFSEVKKRYPIHFASIQGYTYIMQLLLGRRPGEEMEQRVVVDLKSQSAELFRDGEVVERTKVSTGQNGTPRLRGRL
jgi:ankyrin repeat protein